MKNIIIIFIFSLSSINVNAQKWALPSSTWTISISGTFPTYYKSIQIEKDTIVQGVLCKKLNNNGPRPILTYEENDTVYFFMRGLFRPTYYFNAEVGDTISFFDNNLCGGDSIVKAVINNIDSINVSNKYLKRFNTEIISNSNIAQFSYSYYSYIENIGSNYIFPYFYCANTIDQEGIEICNYGDSTIQDFYVFKNDCVGVSIDELENQNSQISIYPNPVADFLNVQLDFNTESKILTIRNTMGQIVQEFIVTEGENSLDISYLSSGVYFATLNKGIEQQTFKFIKE